MSRLSLCRRAGFRPSLPAFLLLAVILGGCAGRVATSPAPGQAGPEAQAAPAAPQTITPGTPLGPSAAGGQVRIALLLPLSGPNAGIGHALLDAAQMALFDIADDRFALLPRDTQGTPEGAAAAATAALGDGAQLILGPLLAGEVQAVKPVARQAHVNIVAFSTSDQLADDGTFLLSILPRQTVRRVVTYAHQQGLSRFAALAPRTAYGELVADELRQAATAVGGTVEQVQFYDPSANDLRPTVRALAGNANFDSVMLADGGAKLKAVASLLPYFDIDPGKVRILGTGVWDEPGLGSEPALVGGWFAAPDPSARADFEKRFRDLYKQAPPRLATLGYDATALAALLAKRPPDTAFSAASLTDPSGFAGVDGIFRFLPDGRIERGLAVLEVEKSGTKVISPAPETFEQPTM